MKPLGFVFWVAFLATSGQSVAACRTNPDFFSPRAKEVASSRHAGKLIFLLRPGYTDDQIDLTRSRDAWVLSSGCYQVPVPDGATISLSVNNASLSREALPRTFLGVQIFQLSGAGDLSEVDFEISREHPFYRNGKMISRLPAKVLPIDLNKWNTAHLASELKDNDSALGRAWHGSPAESEDDSWDLRRCWTLEAGSNCWRSDMADRLKGREALIQNRLLSYFPAPTPRLGKGIGIEILKRSEAERIIIRYHSPSSPQKGEVELCFEHCN